MRFVLNILDRGQLQIISSPNKESVCLPADPILQNISNCKKLHYLHFVWRERESTLHSTLELETKVHTKVCNHGEGTYVLGHSLHLCPNFMASYCLFSIVSCLNVC